MQSPRYNKQAKADIMVGGTHLLVIFTRISFHSWCIGIIVLLEIYATTVRSVHTSYVNINKI